MSRDQQALRKHENGVLIGPREAALGRFTPLHPALGAMFYVREPDLYWSRSTKAEYVFGIVGYAGSESVAPAWQDFEAVAQMPVLQRSWGGLQTSFFFQLATSRFDRRFIFLHAACNGLPESRAIGSFQK